MNKRKTLKRNRTRKNLKRNGTRKNKKTKKRKNIKNKLGGAFNFETPFYFILDDELILGEAIGKLAVTNEHKYIVKLLEGSEDYEHILIQDKKYGQVFLLTKDEINSLLSEGKMRIVTKYKLTEERQNLVKKRNTRKKLVDE